MPRKSAAALTVVGHAIKPAVSPLSPPDGLPGPVLAVWAATVAALPASWFTPEQSPLLERYSRHVSRAQELERWIAETDPLTPTYARLVSLAAAETGRILALARSMRMTHQARHKAETAASAVAKHSPVRTIEVLLEQGARE